MSMYGPDPAAGWADANGRGPAPDADTDDDEEPDRPSAPPRTSTRLIGQVLTLQLLCIGVLTWLGRTDRVVLATAAVLPAMLALSVVTFRSRTFGAWVGIWLSWRRRRGRATAISDEGDPINPLWLLDRDLSIGSIRGFRRSELGILQLGRAWVAAAWVTGGPRSADPDASDGLTALLSLAPSPTPGTTLCTVFQQATTDLGAGRQQQLTAWLSVRVEPLQAFPPGRALTAVPTMVRSELRRLQRSTADGVLRFVPLDRSDLLSALAASTEVPLAPSPTAVETVDESWHLWQARGRFHHAFELHPGARRPAAVLVALAMDLAGYDPDAVLTICVPYPSTPRRRTGRLPVARLSHHDPVRLMNLAEEIMDALDGEGAATRPLSGRHGPALLDSSILAGPGRR